MSETLRRSNSRDRSWLVRAEILAIVFFNVALLFLGLLSWIAFAAVAVESGMYTAEAGSPFQEDHVPSSLDHYIKRAYTTVGYWLCASIVGLPAVFLISLAILLHRLVVKPLAAREPSG